MNIKKLTYFECVVCVVHFNRESSWVRCMNHPGTICSPDVLAVRSPQILRFYLAGLIVVVMRHAARLVTDLCVSRGTLTLVTH